MATQVTTINVSTVEQMQQAIMSYVAQGFVVSAQAADTTTLFKKKEFNILWAIVGLLLCEIPLLIYCIIYAQEKDRMVVVRVDPAAAAAGALNAAAWGGPSGDHNPIWSEDRRWWWNGTAWIDSERALPPGVQYSPDGQQWWDGGAWRQAPRPDADAPSSTPNRQTNTESGAE